MTALPYDLERYDIHERRIATNGIELNVFEAGSGPTVVLLHGFPECWASWGPQFGFLVDRGYHVLAPEQRGFGASDAPAETEAYDLVELAADVAGLIESLDDGPAVVIGHDWGCLVAWHTAWLHADRLAGVGGLSVPWFGRGEAPITAIMDTLFPDDYFYLRDFQRPETTALLERDHRDSLTRMLTGDMPILGQPQDERTFLERIEVPDEAPQYMPPDFIDYLVSRYRFHGFGPPHNWYRNYERTFERTAEYPDDVIRVPAMYLTGSGEWTVELSRTLGLDEFGKFVDLRVSGVAEAGHWLGQEQPEWVNLKAAAFLRSIEY